MTEMVGWASALILAMTISRQVYTQWRTKSCDGVSSWLFIGQFFASLGFVLYSFLLDNWVFVLTNTFNLFAAMTGQWIYSRNKNGGRKSIAGVAASSK